jgi:DNA mismatch endonuclease (patch repair protein)
MDVFTTEKRSAVMAAIRSKDTKPEMAVRSIAHRLGYRFRLHRKDLAGKPDLAFPGRKAVLFVHGCFWHQHGCKRTRPPKSHQEYWDTKLGRNVARDARNRASLEQAGWKVGVVWECESCDADKVASVLDELLSATPQPPASTAGLRHPQPS